MLNHNLSKLKVLTAVWNLVDVGSVDNPLFTAGSWSTKVLVKVQLLSYQTIIPIMINTFADAQAGEDGVVITMWIILKLTHISD